MNMKRMAIVAIVGLAALCEIGIGCSKTATDADANSEADAAVAPKLLGDIYAKGIVGVPPDMEKAGAMYCNAAAISRKNGEWKDECRYLEKAIKYGSIEARARLGIRLLQGKGVAKNTDRAKTLICPEDDDAPGAAYALWAEIVCRGLDKRKWIISDADDALNAYMEAAAFLNGKKVHIISTAKDLNEDCQDELSQLIKAEKVGGKRCSDLVAVLKKDGILPFIQDWFAADPDLGSKVLMIGVPDFWIVGGYVPVPSNLAFVGMRSKTRIVPEGWTGEGENEKLQKIWARLNKRVDVGKKLPKNEILRRRWVRQRFGMIANNAAFLLAEAGRDADALDICGAIVELIDPDNVSAIFNAFEIVRRMKNPNAEVKQAVEKKLKQIGDDPKKRHQRWTLSRSYGYVYNAEIFAKMGYAWAKSGAFDMAKGAKGASGLKMKK